MFFFKKRSSSYMFNCLTLKVKVKVTQVRTCLKILMVVHLCVPFEKKPFSGLDCYPANEDLIGLAICLTV